MQNRPRTLELVSLAVAAGVQAALAARVDAADDGLADIGYEAAHPALQSPFWQEAVQQVSSGCAP